jgi:cation diffusion facilitator CzcD-associated flavoprotein CzcO
LDRLTGTRGFDGGPDIAIIGAGFGGIGMAMQLQRHGFGRFTIFEKADGVGGVWRDNTYPGAGCDVPSHLYSYSFERRSNWSRHFPKQPEILDYLETCVGEHGLRAKLRLGTEVTSATWDDDRAKWTLTTADGNQQRFDVVVWGLGQLNRPRWPEIEGLDTFGGTVFHSARWNHDHDLTGERVAVIGNGASSVQFVPPIAEKTAKLHQFQRSPNWLLPKPDAPFSKAEIRRFSRIPLWERINRSKIYALFEVRWLALRSGSKSGKLARDIGTKFITSQVADPELRAKLIPDYPVGCKRILISNDYLSTLCRDDVEVVTDPIVRVEADAIVTADGTRREVDTIIVATGFEATDFLAPVEIVGRDGRRLHAEWKRGAAAYQGIAVPGYPNLFILYGPNTNLGHNSIIFMLESQYRYVLANLRRLRDGARAVDVRPEAASRYDAWVTKALHRTVWEAGCDSWYKNEDGKVTNNWPSFTLRYWWDTHRLKTRDLEIDDAARR